MVLKQGWNVWATRSDLAGNQLKCFRKSSSGTLSMFRSISSFNPLKTFYLAFTPFIYQLKLDLQQQLHVPKEITATSVLGPWTQNWRWPWKIWRRRWKKEGSRRGSERQQSVGKRQDPGARCEGQQWHVPSPSRYYTYCTPVHLSNKLLA